MLKEFLDIYDLFFMVIVYQARINTGLYSLIYIAV